MGNLEKRIVVAFAKVLTDFLRYEVNKRKITVQYHKYLSESTGNKIFDCKFDCDDLVYGHVTVYGDGAATINISRVALYFPNLRERIGQRNFTGHTTTYQLI